MQSNYSIYIQYCKWKRNRKGKFKGSSKLKRKKGSGRWFISLIISEKHCRITSIISPSWMVSETKTQNNYYRVYRDIFHYICILLLLYSKPLPNGWSPNYLVSLWLTLVIINNLLLVVFVLLAGTLFVPFPFLLCKDKKQNVFFFICMEWKQHFFG